MLENGRSKKENGGVIIEGKKKGHHKDIQRWEMTSRSVKEKKCKSSSTYLQLNDKNAINNKHLQKEVLIPSWFFSFHRHRCWLNILEIKALDSCCFCLLLLILATYFILNLLAKTDDAHSKHSQPSNLQFESDIGTVLVGGDSDQLSARNWKKEGRVMICLTIATYFVTWWRDMV